MTMTWEIALINEIVGYGIDGQTGNRSDIELLGNVAPVGDDRIDRDEQMVGNLLVRHALYEADDDVLLAFRDPILSLDTLVHIRQARRDAVVLDPLLQQADGWHEQLVLDVAVISQPLLIYIYIIEGGGQLIVRQPVVRQILDDDALELLVTPQQSLDIREECLLFIAHVLLNVVGIIVV